jgi:hypothetical protein
MDASTLVSGTGPSPDGEGPAEGPADGPAEGPADGPAEGPAFEDQARLALQALAELDGGKGVSLPRLAKRTGLRVSVLLRLFTLLSDARVGDSVGPGWVRLVLEEDGRWMASMTAAGRGDPEQWDHSTP